MLRPEFVSPESIESRFRDSIFEILVKARLRANLNSDPEDFVRQVSKDLKDLSRTLDQPLNSKVALKFDYYEVLTTHKFLVFYRCLSFWVFRQILIDRHAYKVVWAAFNNLLTN
jgi:hypothetical protein